MSDPRITGQPEFSGERSTLDDLPPLPSLVRRRPPVWTPGQLSFLVGQFVVMTGLFRILILANYSYVQILWTHPAGIKMLVMTFGGAVVGTVIYLAVIFALNRALLGKDRHRSLHAALSVLIGVIYLLLCFVPAAFVFLVGPAAIQIMDNLGP
jgi:hypothetical protein